MNARYQSLYFFLIFSVIICITACTKNEDPGVQQQQQNPVIDSAETIYVSGGRTKDLHAINAKNGAIKWKVTLGGDAKVSPIYTNGKVIVGATDNKLYAFDTSGNLSWTVTLNNSIASAPIANNGIVYISDINSIYAFNCSNGSIIWQFHEGGTGSLVFKDNEIYCNSKYYYLYSINANNGVKKWEYFSSLGRTPVVFSDRIYYLVSDWTMQILSKSNATLLSSGGGWDVYSDAESYNVKYGNIYILRSGVRSGIEVADSANPSQYKFSMRRPSIFTPPSMSPIVADSLAIVPYGVYNAITGEDLNVNILSANSTTGLTYLNKIVYCVTAEKNFYDPYTGGYTYADVNAVDIKGNRFLWNTSIKNAKFFGVEPCIVTKSGTVYRGAFQFK